MKPGITARRSLTCRDAARRMKESEDGATVVETALSAMILLALVLGIMETSMALYAYHFTSEAAREATRYAIVRGSACSGFSSGCPAQASDVEAFVKALDYPGIDPSSIAVTTAWPTAGASCTPSSSPCNNAGNLVAVTVRYQFLWSIPFVPSNKLNMTSTSEMVISQ